MTDANRTFSGPISRERQKKTGEVFTPDVLIAKMWNKAIAHDPDLCKPEKTFFEPAAGDGNIILYVVRAKLAAGQTLAFKTERNLQKYMKGTLSEAGSREVEERLKLKAADTLIQSYKTTYACEYMKDNVDAIKARLLELLAEYPYPIAQEAVMAEVKDTLDRNIAHCNTLDPWDTTDDREWPVWLVERTSPEALLELYKRSKHVKSFKAMERSEQADHLYDILQIVEYLSAEEKKSKQKKSPQQSLL